MDELGLEWWWERLGMMIGALPPQPGDQAASPFPGKARLGVVKCPCSHYLPGCVDLSCKQESGRALKMISGGVEDILSVGVQVSDPLTGLG